MTLEAGKEMDKRCVLGWLTEIYRHPKVAFNTYSDEQQIEFAYDAIILLKEKEPKKPEWRVGRAHCPECGELFPRKKDTQYIRYCSFCGQAVKWDD